MRSRNKNKQENDRKKQTQKMENEMNALKFIELRCENETNE